MEQCLWALDISLQYSDNLAMFQLLQFVSNGTLDMHNHVFDVPPLKQEAKKRRRRLHGTEEEVGVERGKLTEYRVVVLVIQSCTGMLY